MYRLTGRGDSRRGGGNVSGRAPMGGKAGGVLEGDPCDMR